MMPRDTNPQGTIFGGVILSLIDQAAFCEALRQGAHRYVTVAMDSIEFHKPVFVGDLVSLWPECTRIGRTSVTLHVVVFASDRATLNERKVTEAQVTMVAVDEAGNAIPIVQRAHADVPTEPGLAE